MSLGERAGRIAIAATFGGLASEASGGNFEDGALVATIMHLYGQKQVRHSGPIDSKGVGGVGYIGGAADEKTGLMREAYDNVEIPNKAYFAWYQKEDIAAWIKAHNGNVILVGHSWGADTGAELVAAGLRVNKLVMVDAVGWSRPNFANIVATIGKDNFIYINSSGGLTVSNIIAFLGRKYGDISNYATGPGKVQYDHQDVCTYYCRETYW